MMSVTSLVPFALVAVVAVVQLYRRATRFSIKHIRGPPGSFWRGNIRNFFYQQNVGDLDFKYLKEYGTAWRMGAPLGQDMLMVADPKALQHMFHKSGYNYPKSVETVVGTRLVAGISILWAPAGPDHSRHRKVMNPAFSAPQLRSFLPIFRRSAKKLCGLWKTDVFGVESNATKPANSDGEVISVNSWLARTTLDVIGETAFHYRFGALDNSKNEVSEAYHNMFVDSTLHPPLWNTLFRGIWRFLPWSLLSFVRYIPTREYKRFRNTLTVINNVSKTLVEDAIHEIKINGTEAAEAGKKGKKDVMSVLVRANLSENPSTQLSKDEMISEMAALTLAGHETTANTLTWLLWELAKHPDIQDRLREEIREKRKEINSRGFSGNEDDEDADFRMDDLEGMPYLQALLKEVLRFHPIVYHLVRQAGKDDVIPLSEPITTSKGEVIDEIPVRKGQAIMVSICTYNRLKSVWGPDADEFNPTRFLEDGKVENSVKVGMFGNLMSFSAGLRGCIGWRFSLIEMQAILVALVEEFEFSLPASKEKDAPEILRMPVGLMSPMIKGRLNEGVSMPLCVKPLSS